jgi:hypothetical protein
MTKRQFPFSPRTSRELDQGDIIAVPCEGGRWTCLQVVELKRAGAGSSSSLVVGPLPWSGAEPPTDRDVEGLAVTEQALTRIELFTEGGLQVVTNSPCMPTTFASNYRDFAVGTQTRVWGWRTAIRKAMAAAEATSSNVPVRDLQTGRKCPKTAGRARIAAWMRMSGRRGMN